MGSATQPIPSCNLFSRNEAHFAENIASFDLSGPRIFYGADPSRATLVTSTEPIAVSGARPSDSPVSGSFNCWPGWKSWYLSPILMPSSVPQLTKTESPLPLMTLPSHGRFCIFMQI